MSSEKNSSAKLLEIMREADREPKAITLAYLTLQY